MVKPIATAFLALAPVALGAAMPSPADAQASTTRGWNLGFQLQGSSLTVEGEELETGGGAGLGVGYGFNRSWTLFLDLDGAVVRGVSVPDVPDVSGDWTMGHADLGIRYYFASSLRRWIPWVEAALGGRAVAIEDVMVDGEEVDVALRGSTLSLGAGIGFYLTETLSLDFGARFTGGRFTERDVGDTTIRDVDLEAQSARWGFGLTWWP
jgi:Outer membrane protein beta-barrel domain